MRKYFIEEDLMSEELDEEASGDGCATEIDLKQLELEHKAREQKRQWECQLKMKELEIREKK